MDIEEIRAAWRTYGERVASSEISFESSLKVGGEAPGSVTRSTFVFSKWGSVGELMPLHDADAAEMVSGRNQAYDFTLQRTPGNSKWAIEEVTVRGSDPSPIQNLDPAPLLSLGVAGDARTVLDRDDISALPPSLEGEFIRLELVEANIEKPVVQGERSPPRYVGSLLLDPRASYVVKRADLRRSDGTTPSVVVVENRFRIENDLPIPEELVVTTTSASPDGSTNEIVERAGQFTYTVSKSIPPERFTLSHYGLPEPLGIQKPGSYRTQPWLYYFVGGVMCVAAGAFAVHRATRGGRAA